MWTEIKTQADIDDLLELFGHFHDSCIRDIYISTREFVDEKLAMSFSNTLSASLLFQRQFRPNSVIELKFEEVEKFNFLPFKETENGVIYDTTLKTENGLFYWADFAGWETGDDDSIWINGRKLSWRLRPELIGNTKRIKDA